MKSIIIVIVALFFWTGAFSQTRIPWTEGHTEGMMNGTPYIFEGVVIDTMYYNNCSLTAVKVQIIHVYRGDLNPGTIELVDNFGGRWENGIFMHKMIGERTTPMQPGTKGLFFCNKSTYKPSLMKTDNDIRVVPIEGIGGQGGDGAYYLFDKKFNNKKELYQFFSKYPNITIPKDTVKIEEPPLKQTQAQKAEADSIKQVQNKLLYEQRKKNNEQYMEQRMKIINEQQKKKDIK